MTDYPDSLDTRALTTWPGLLTPAHQRERSPYSAGLTSTLSLLSREFRAVACHRPVLEVAIPEGQWRVDGRPYARAQAEHPGVVLSLPSSAAGPLRFACDRYTSWPANLRAVALTMEALRAVERHGAVQAREQYAGFKALPPGAATAMPAGPPTMTVDDAARVLVDHAGADPGVASYRDLLPGLGGGGSRRGEYLAHVWRSAVRRHHPDVGGDPDAWARVEQAKRVLDEAVGGGA